MRKKFSIPRVPHVFFKWYCKPERYEELHGDLEEFFYECAGEKGLFRARLFYIWNVLRCFQPYAWKIFQSQNSNTAMFKNFYFTTVRNLSKHKSYFLINVCGLAVGIASFTFISLFIINELSYDRFHTEHDRIFRVNNEAVIKGQMNEQAETGAPMAKTLVETYPEVVNATRVLKSSQLLIGKGAQKFNEDGVLYADSEFFNVFDFKLVKGNPTSALSNPNSIVLSESYAKKYFGDEDPVGKQLTVDHDSVLFTITGVVEDVPPNSHIQFDMLGSLNSKDHGNTTRWIGRSLHVYAQLVKGAGPEGLQEKMKDLFYLYMAPEIEYYTGLTIEEWEGAGNSVGFKLTPIKDIHLHSTASYELEPTGNVAYIYVYGLIGIIILFIAIFNFVNLATAHSSTRAKEVGVRKVIGSTKRVLIYQFLFESIIISTAATILGIGMVLSLMPYFIELIGKDLAYSLSSGFIGWMSMALLAIIIGVLAGFYPSFVLSAFKPVDVLKGTAHSGSKGGWLRSALVTLQFTASIIIIVGTVSVYSQIEFMLTKSLGFDKDQILVLRRPDMLNQNTEVFKNDLLKNPNIKTVANSETIPGKTYQIRSYRKEGENEVYLFLNNQVTYEHQELMGLELVAGRFFSKDIQSDSNAVVLNESAVKAFGFDDPIGKPLTSAFKKGRITVIGVVKDYNIESLHKSITPVSIELDADNDNGYISVKMTSGQDVRQTLEFIEEQWTIHTNNKPLQYFFFDQEYENLYKTESATGRVLMVFATLSVFIACMGLIGLITYTSSIRKKEIGIRKVLGAGTGTLIRLLSSEVVRLIAIATLISWPLAYLATDYWLQNFADRTTINLWTYVIATLVVFVVVGVAISYQTIKASTSDPVDSLRQE